MRETAPWSRRRGRITPVLAVSLGAMLLLPVAASSQEDEPLVNPLPDPAPSNLTLTLEEFAQLPSTEPTPAPTDSRLQRTNRINYLGEVPDGSGRLYVPDLNGPMYLLDEDGDHTLYLDVRGEFEEHFHNHAGLGTGFGFVAFHPEFADNGRFYTVHTESGGAMDEHEPDLPIYRSQSNHGIVTEWTAHDPAADTFAGTHREVLRLGFATQIHGIQQIGFNPTATAGDEDYGLLYVAAGDGGNAVDSDNPRDLSTPQGKLLRIDPLGNDSGNGQYGIPASNPFVGDADALGEIYAYGFRDPHRFSWDPIGNHRLFLGDIGEHQIEEINEIRAGHDYGWADREGPFLARGRLIYDLPSDDDQYDYTYPVAAYDHDRDPGQTGDAGVAVVGGFVYRGADLPQLRGWYVFGDIVRGHVYGTRAGQMRIERGSLAPIERLALRDADGRDVTMQDLADDTRVDLRFGVDGDGELYVLSKSSGTIWRVTDAQRN